MYTSKEGGSVLLRVHGDVNHDNQQEQSLLSISVDVSISSAAPAVEEYDDITETLVDAVYIIDKAMGVFNNRGRSTSQWSIYRRGITIMDNDNKHHHVMDDDAASLYTMILSAELPYKHRLASIRTTNKGHDKAEIWEYVTLEGRHAKVL